MLYIAASDQEMFRISTKTWERVHNGTDNVLMRSGGRLEPITLAPRGSSKAFESIADVPNFSNGFVIKKVDLRLLYKVAVLSVFFPEVMRTRPLVCLHGEKGSGKTAAGRAVGVSLYGPKFQVADLDKDKLDGLDAIMTTQAFAVVDNVDGRVRGLENKLALAATGGVITRRKLYTTLDTYEARVIAFLWFTSRDPSSFTRDDVVDRLLYFPCERRATFEPESALMNRIEANRPAFWRWLLDTMPKILKALESYRPDSNLTFRLADFAHFALAIAPVLGVDRRRMLKALADMEMEKQQFAASQSILPAAFEALTTKALVTSATKLQYIDTPLSATKLLEGLASAWPQGAHHFPFKRATTLGVTLRDQLVALRSAGVNLSVEVSTHDKAKLYTLKMPVNGGTAPKK